MKLYNGYQSFAASHLEAQLAERVRQFTATHPERAILKLGLSDATRPMPPIVTSAMQMAVGELGAAISFRGYGPAQGQPYLRRAIHAYYARMGVALEEDDIFVNAGAREEFAALSDLFAADNVVLLPTPAHPMYEAQNFFAARPVLYAEGNAENGFLPPPPEGSHADLIYLSSPANPTGVAYTREALTAWVDYANREGAVLLCDAAYQTFATSEDVPHSIYEIPGAMHCAIEVSTLSKSAGFTGVRCGYTVVPASLVRDGQSLRELWTRRVEMRTCGASSIAQRGAEAALSADGAAELLDNTRYYLRNAARLRAMLTALEIPFFGGVDAPYVWFPCPDGMDGMALFEALLTEANVVGTPGALFGKAGEGYFRLSALNSREITTRAVERMRPVLARLYKK